MKRRGTRGPWGSGRDGSRNKFFRLKVTFRTMIYGWGHHEWFSLWQGAQHIGKITVAPQIAGLSAQMPIVHRSSPEPTHWGATEYCQRHQPSPLSWGTLLFRKVAQGRDCLTRAGSSKNLLPQDYTLNYRQSHWLLSRFLFLFIRMPGSKGHLVHYFRLWNRFNMAFLSLTISHPPSRIVSMQNYLPYDNLRKE